MGHPVGSLITRSRVEDRLLTECPIISGPIAVETYPPTTRTRHTEGVMRIALVRHVDDHDHAVAGAAGSVAVVCDDLVGGVDVMNIDMLPAEATRRSIAI